MIEHIKISPLTTMWYIGIFACVVFNALLLLITHRLSIRKRDILRKSLGWLFVIEFIATQLYLLLITKTWSMQDSLPLHLCRMSFVVGVIAILTKKQFLYEWSVYLGLPGGIHAILTPELTQGDSIWMLFDYYFAHAGLIAVPLLLTLFYKMFPRPKAHYRIFIVLNIALIPVFLLNLLMNSNYFYLVKKPIAENPFLIGPWPWYIAAVEVALIIHLAIIYTCFHAKPILNKIRFKRQY